MNKIQETLKKELRVAELINRIKKEERENGELIIAVPVNKVNKKKGKRKK